MTLRARLAWPVVVCLAVFVIVILASNDKKTGHNQPVPTTSQVSRK